VRIRPPAAQAKTARPFGATATWGKVDMSFESVSTGLRVPAADRARARTTPSGVYQTKSASPSASTPTSPRIAFWLGGESIWTGLNSPLAERARAKLCQQHVLVVPSKRLQARIASPFGAIATCGVCVPEPETFPMNVKAPCADAGTARDTTRNARQASSFATTRLQRCILLGGTPLSSLPLAASKACCL
jgi:hypothetical protein